MEKLYLSLPNRIQNLIISVFNWRMYRVRMGGAYKQYRAHFKKMNTASRAELESDNDARLKKLLLHCLQNCDYYKNLVPIEQAKKMKGMELLKEFPIISKETLRQNIEKFQPTDLKKTVAAKTGGTTGKSLTVYFTPENMQERFAMLDNFRSLYGYELGQKTAWFSGKNILNNRDLKARRFWKTDYLYRVRYYSTFHVHQEYLEHYLQDLNRFQPLFLVGFPSVLLEIARYGERNDIRYEGTIKAIFPTAESITEDSRAVLEGFFNAPVVDQYASSEGAPFIFECQQGHLHLELQSGVFEVLNEADIPSAEGRMVVTSFTTYGTPLVRYDIGDRIELSDQVCDCGNNNPIAARILGRIDDFIYSPERGKINLGNISNTLKGVKNVIRFQVQQHELNQLQILMVVAEAKYTKESEAVFMQNWRDRVGEQMKIELKYVQEIPNAKSGKYRMVINTIKDQLDQ